MNGEQIEHIPVRSEVQVEHTWDLSSLFPSESAWEEGLTQFEALIPEISRFKGSLGKSAAALRECLDFMMNLEKLGERLGYYAMLRVSENTGSSEHQARYSRYMRASSTADTNASYQAPEIQAIPQLHIDRFMQDSILSDYRIYLGKLLRFKPHILSESEERLLAMQEESNDTARKSFSALTDVDMDFGIIETPGGKRPLSNSSFNSLMIHPDRETRKKAYAQYYAVFDTHKNTLSSLYAGSVQLDIYKARARHYPSALEAKLFPDKVPVEVYNNLITEVHYGLPALHDYYRLRKERMGLDSLRMYDVKVPLVPEVQTDTTYEEAVRFVIEALNPLGEEYISLLKFGLLDGRWVDRYENKGKRSGAFSAGSFSGKPYILMNYKNDDIRDVFTLAHEAGHSMHSYYSSGNNLFQHYNYTIFEAEVASTFNEQLLFKHMISITSNDAMRRFLINKRIDDIIGTLFRQTMFAEFERTTHQMVENGIPLTVDSLREEYRKLLYHYFGPDVVIEDVSTLECLRIPHFYRSFYVYKYATGISAALALSGKVLSGGEREKSDYFRFLRSGGSKYPLESLEAAGVDMSKPEPVRTAIEIFKESVEELKSSV